MRHCRRSNLFFRFKCFGHFTYFISFAMAYSFRRRLGEMTAIIFGVAIIAFFIGWAVFCKAKRACRTRKATLASRMEVATRGGSHPNSRIFGQ